MYLVLLNVRIRITLNIQEGFCHGTVVFSKCFVLAGSPKIQILEGETVFHEPFWRSNPSSSLSSLFDDDDGYCCHLHA